MAPEKKVNPKKSDKSSNNNNRYLFYYNLIQFLGWTYILTLVVIFYSDGARTTKRLWDFVKIPIIIFQLGSLLEIVHAIVGLVKSSIMITAIQILFRLINVFGVLQIIPPHLDSIGVTMTVIAWSLTEIIRYLFYVYKENNSSPFLIVWLRYTSFIVLMPLGVSGELISLWLVQGYISETGLYSFKLPYIDVTLNYRILCLLLIPLIIRGFFTMYNHMFSLRRKVSKGSSDSAK